MQTACGFVCFPVLCGLAVLAAVSGTMTVEVKDSTGAPLKGAYIVFKKVELPSSP